jgi:hypothetical protein
VRLSLPERIPINWVIALAAIIAAIQVYQRTDYRVAGMLFLFEVVWAINFNFAGGFTTAVGAYVFWYGLLTLILGSIVKMVIHDPVDMNALAPLPTVDVYVASMVVMTPVILVARKITGGRPGLAERLSGNTLNLRNAAIGSLAIGLLPILLYPVLPLKFLTAFNQINHFAFFAIILGTVDVIRSSGGRSAFSWVNVAAILSIFFLGVVGFSKEAMFTPLVLWLITCIYCGFRFRLPYLVGVALVAYFCIHVLVPVSQIGRFDPVAQYGTMGTRFRVATSMMLDPGKVRAEYLENSALDHETGSDFYSRDVGFAARLTRWTSDDPLIAYTLQGHVIGLGYLEYQIVNWVPHIFFPNKEKYEPDGGGNFYAHELGILSADDTTTGVSFGPAAEAFHLGGWTGVVVAMPLCWLPFFVSIYWLGGDLRKSPWGIFYVVYFAHMAPEGGIGAVVSAIWYVNLGFVLGMFFGTYIAPLIGSFLASGKLTAPLAPQPRLIATSPL